MGQLFMDTGDDWQPLGFVDADALQFESTEEDLAIPDLDLSGGFSMSFEFTDPDGGLSGFFESVLLEADLAEHDAYEDTLAMESIEEQDRLAAWALADIGAVVSRVHQAHLHASA